MGVMMKRINQKTPARKQRSRAAARRRVALAAGVSCTALLGARNIARAATIDWNGGTGGAGSAWLTASNWNGGFVPNTTDTARFGSVGTATTIGVNVNNPTNNGTNNQAVGSIIASSALNRNLTINNSSTAVNGFLT